MAKIGTGAAEGKRTAYINANVLDGTEGMEMLENHAGRGRGTAHR